MGEGRHVLASVVESLQQVRPGLQCHLLCVGPAYIHPHPLHPLLDGVNGTGPDWIDDGVDFWRCSQARLTVTTPAIQTVQIGTAQRFGVSSIWDPRQNIEGGSRYMRFLLDMFDGDVKLALAGYNAGEGAVMKYGYRIPPYSETQEYVRRISTRYNLIRDPLAYRNANSLTPEQIAANQRKESAPLTIYERSVFAVRLPDGRLRLVTQ